MSATLSQMDDKDTEVDILKQRLEKMERETSSRFETTTDLLQQQRLATQSSEAAGSDGEWVEPVTSPGVSDQQKRPEIGREM